MKKIIFVLIGFTFVLAAGLSLAENPASKEPLQRAVIRIDGITCGGCFSTINEGMAGLDGFSGMGANLFRKLIAVDFKAPLTVEKISARLKEVGYPGELQSVEPVSEKESFASVQAGRSALRSSCGGPGTGSCVIESPAAAGSVDSIPQAGSCCDLGTTLPPAKDL